MGNKKLILALFLLMVIAQLYVPLNMMLKSEGLLKDGRSFQFVVRPVDPNDPFRGKYITLNFEENTFERNQEDAEWESAKTAYAIIDIEEESGFAKVIALSLEAPTTTHDYVKIEIDYVNNKDVHFSLPFKRFYMTENQAHAAEDLMNKVLRNDETSHFMTAEVRIRDGEYYLVDVYYQGKSLRDYLDEGEDKGEGESR